MMLKITICISLCVLSVKSNIIRSTQSVAQVKSRVDKVLEDFPIFDGHNDLTSMLKNVLNNVVSSFNFSDDLTLSEFFRY